MARGDVLRINLPAPPGGSGREQAGRRPAIVVQTDSPELNLPTLMVVPTTGELAALRFPFTFQVQPTPRNGLTMPSVVLVFQLRAIDRVRILEIVGQLEPEHLERLNNEMRRLLQL
jgi:mRNA interferase MazF